jgi:hypothetical protein
MINNPAANQAYVSKFAIPSVAIFSLFSARRQ